MKLVFDTNIYLAAMWKKDSLCGRLFFDITQKPRENQIYTSPEILSELYEKSKILIAKKLITRELFRRIIILIYKKTWQVIGREKIYHIKNDPSDNRILECAVAAHADLIITMDKKHLLKLKQFRGIGIIHPQDFVYMLLKK